MLVAIGLVALPFWDAATSGGGGGGGGGNDLEDLAQIIGGLAGSAISWRRLRIEWNGRPEEWETFIEGLLTKRFSRAERKSGWEPHELPPSGVRRAVTHLWLHHHHGLTPTRVEQLAERHGWSVDWAKSTVVKGELRFFRLIPPPEHVDVPDPHGPPPATGSPWGPMRCRVVIPLLTLLLMPRVRFLELRRSPDAYVRHLREHLKKLFRAELARERGKNAYRADSTGRILRRVSVGTRHFRGAGAGAVLRVALEQGWRLDRSYPADPRDTVHLCRLNDGGRRTR
ncbi:hypothetical protein ACWC9T_31370 [Kitasatospora sp. NPDC001159]